LLLVLLVGTSAAIWFRVQAASAEEVLGTVREVFGSLCCFAIADQSQYSTIRLRDAADPQREITLSDSMVTIIIDDVSPLVNVAGLLHTFGKTYRVQGEASTSLTDLRRGPSVFIGAFDNGWTLRLTSPLRFHFANDPEMTQFWIEDRANPGKRGLGARSFRATADRNL